MFLGIQSKLFKKNNIFKTKYLVNNSVKLVRMWVYSTKFRRDRDLPYPERFIPKPFRIQPGRFVFEGLIVL